MRVDRMVWWFIAVSTLFYGVLAYGAERQYTLQPFMRELLRPIAIIFYAVALVIYAMSFFVPPLIDRTRRSIGVVVVRLAMLETVALSGLLAAFVIHDWRIYLPAWALSLIGMLRVYPV